MRQHFQQILVAAFALTISGAIHAETQDTVADSPALIPITIDAGTVLGEIRPLHDLHNAPLTERGTVDLSTYYQELGVRYIRIHDTPWTFDPGVDIHFVFPKFDDDPDDPNNYIFDKTDEVVQSVKNIGGEVIYRLGESAELANRQHNNPPADYDKWARVGVNIIRHYNEGWANGFHHNVRYWEIWNEPDIPNFWTGSREDYFRLYETTVRAIKELDPELRVGGPALASNLEFLESFLAFCKEKSLPLDFVSFHYYGVSAAGIAQRVRDVRELVDRYGYPEAETMLTEWCFFNGDWARLHVLSEAKYTRNIFDQVRGPVGAAYAASVLAFLQDTPLDIANYYSGTTLWWGMFDTFGVPYKNFYSFRAFKQLLATPDRIAAQGSDDDAFAVLAGRAKDQTSVSVMISNVRTPNEGYRVQLDNLPWTGPSKYELYVMDAVRDLERVAGGTLTATELVLTDGTTPPSVHLLKLSSAATAVQPTTDPQPAETAGAIPVEVKKEGDGWQLLRGGQPYEVRGVSYVGPDFDGLTELHVNSIRNWGVNEDTQALLDDAHAHGLSVMLGLWVNHESSFNVETSDVHEGIDFDYRDAEKVRGQLEEMRAAVRRYKDHPALLMWGVGNEVMFNSVHHKEILRAINDIAKMIKEEDPNHPAATVICRVGREKMDLYREYCPDVDILGLNGYREMTTLPQRLAGYGWDGPFLITEYGANGPWEVDKSPWNAPLEPNSTQKARSFESIARNVVQSNPNCLGSYAFVWCDKQDGLLPWFNMQLPGDILLEPATVLAELWSGTIRENHPPTIGKKGISIRHEDSVQNREWYEYPPGAEVICSLNVGDADGDPLDIRWRLCSDLSSEQYFGETVGQASGNGATLRLPDSETTVCYRLTVTIMDDHGHGATASVPIRVSKYYNPI